MTLIEQFCQEVEAFLAESQMNATALGREALNDPGFVFDLRSGRAPSLRTVERVREFMVAKSRAASAAEA